MSKLSIIVFAVSMSVTTASADPSRSVGRSFGLALQKGFYAAKAVVLRPKDSVNTVHKARQVLGRKLRFGEKVSVLAAHGYGVGRVDARGKVHWKPGVIHRKARLLQSFTRGERHDLFKARVVGWVLVVKRDDYIRREPYRYNGKWYRDVDAAARAMERDKGESVRIEVNDSGYVTLPR